MLAFQEGFGWFFGFRAKQLRCFGGRGGAVIIIIMIIIIIMETKKTEYEDQLLE